jgi:hypothetical protein
MGLFLHFRESAQAPHNGFVFADLSAPMKVSAVFRVAQDRHSAMPNSGFVFAFLKASIPRRSSCFSDLRGSRWRDGLPYRGCSSSG